MEKETIYEMKSLDMKLGDLDKKRKQTIIQIIEYSCWLALGITALIIGIIKKDTCFCIVYPIFNIFVISLIVIFAIQLRDINKLIKAVCKAIADLISKETKKVFEKMREDITDILREIKPNKPCSVVNPKSFVPEEEKAKEEKKEPKKTPAKKKTTTKKTTKKEINILCVEDGSVDVESLENEGLHDGKVIIYRQGANPPFVLKLKTDDGEFKSEQNKVAVEKLEELKLKLRKLEFQQISTFEAINSMIKELKGESDE